MVYVLKGIKKVLPSLGLLCFLWGVTTVFLLNIPRFSRYYITLFQVAPTSCRQQIGQVDSKLAMSTWHAMKTLIENRLEIIKGLVINYGDGGATKWENRESDNARFSHLIYSEWLKN